MVKSSIQCEVNQGEKLIRDNRILNKKCTGLNEGGERSGKYLFA